MVHDARNVRQLRPRLQGRRSPRSHSPARSGPGRGSRRVAMLDLVFPSLPWEARAFLASLATYHVSEYAIAWAYNRPLLSRDSWLLSTPYCVAMLAGCAEYALELALGFDASRRLESVRLLGLAMVVAGDALRKTAEITARHNFTHKIMTRRRAEHVVVRRGVYRHVRHRATSGGSCGASARRCCSVTPRASSRSPSPPGDSSRTGSRSRRNTSGACSRGSTPPTRRSRPRGYRASREPNEDQGKRNEAPG